MKNLFFTVLLSVFAATLFSSCQKAKNDTTETNTGPTYYIKGKKDGTAFTYSTNAEARITDFSSSAQTISLALMANAKPNESSLEGLALAINFFNGAQPSVGTYSEDNSGIGYLAGGVYNPNSATIVWAAGIHHPTVKPLRIQILTQTNTEMTGTFEGAFYKQDNSIPEFYDDYTLFTEGEFKLPIKR
ncbi:MAG TPA: hypothetical protein VGN63_09305 [Flavisolibacter sp.]|jgi:hypothetical protein|nr:hypothetical protein [Flavisolibacter sp.]